MEDYSVRAIVIGVSLFITMMTVTATVLYFNTARELADQVNKRTDIATSFDSIMNSENFEQNLTGVQVRSLINKYVGNDSVKINIIEISGVETNSYKNINNEYIENDGWLVKINDKSSIISEEKLNLIEPTWTCTVNKVENSGIVKLNIKLNVEK